MPDPERTIPVGTTGEIAHRRRRARARDRDPALRRDGARHEGEHLRRRGRRRARARRSGAG